MGGGRLPSFYFYLTQSLRKNIAERTLIFRFLLEHGDSVNMNSFSNKKMARNHDESRAALCGLCLEKDKNLMKITPVLLDRIQNTVFVDYDLQNPVLPTSVCCNCHRKLF